MGLFHAPADGRPATRRAVVRQVVSDRVAVLCRVARGGGWAGRDARVATGTGRSAALGRFGRLVDSQTTCSGRRHAGSLAAGFTVQRGVGDRYDTRPGTVMSPVEPLQDPARSAARGCAGSNPNWENGAPGYRVMLALTPGKNYLFHAF